MIIPESLAQVNLRWSWPVSGQTAECAFGVDNEASLFDADVIADKVETAYNAGDLRTVQVTTIRLVSILVKLGPNETGASFEKLTSQPGTLSGEGVQPNTSLLITKQTSFGGRRGKGRLYWPGIQDGVIDPYGSLTSGTASTFQTKFTAFLTGLSTADIPMSLLHADPGHSPYLVTSLVVQNLVATQRRRLRH